MAVVAFLALELIKRLAKCCSTASRMTAAGMVSVTDVDVSGDLPKFLSVSMAPKPR